MRILITGGLYVLLVGCATPRPLAPAPPVIFQGCSLAVERPACALDAYRPLFEKGQGADAVALGYQEVKKRTLAKEACIAAWEAAVDLHEEKCEEQLNGRP